MSITCWPAGRGRYRLHDLLRGTPGRIWRSPVTRPTPTPRPGGCSITTCTPPRPPPGTSKAGSLLPPGRCSATRRPSRRLLPAAAQASTWLEAERANLHAAAGYAAAASGRPGHSIAIPAAISGFLFVRGYWDQAAALHRAALETARQIGDRAGQAGALNQLGLLQEVTGDYPAAAASHRQALALFRGLGDRLGQARAIVNLGEVQRLTLGTMRPPSPVSSRPLRSTAASVTGPGRRWPFSIWAACSS